MPYAWRNCSVWNQADVQSVAGSFIVVGDELYSYVSGRSENMQLGQTGLLTLRRDGFASLQPASVGVGAFVLTRPVHWTLERRHLFVNFRGEGLRVAILDAATNRSIAPFSAEACAPLSVDAERLRSSNSARSFSERGSEMERARTARRFVARRRRRSGRPDGADVGLARGAAHHRVMDAMG